MEVVKPFVKWAGGKGSLIPQLTNFLPLRTKRWNSRLRYVEPFRWGWGGFNRYIAKI